MAKADNSLKHQLSQFEGVYCSGFFIPDPAITTALALIFERIHFLNNDELAVRFARECPIRVPTPANAPTVLTVEDDGFVVDPDPYSNEAKIFLHGNPDAGLSEEEKARVFFYHDLAAEFLNRYKPLFGNVFASQFFNPQKKRICVVHTKSGKEIRAIADTLVATHGLDEDLEEHISTGRIPVMALNSAHDDQLVAPVLERLVEQSSSAKLAAALAVRATAITLPATCQADSETILEARHKLKDHLPPFWSSMLKLSVELKTRLGKTDSVSVKRECDDLVDTIVRPALIDLITKLEKERKQWFHRILSPIAKGISILIEKPPITMTGLISTSLRFGANIAGDVSDQIRKVDALKSEGGLAYLIELQKAIKT